MSAVAFCATSVTWALDCDYSAAPDAEYGRNYAAYARWCTDCGGTPYKVNGIGCEPGPDWGHPASMNNSPANTAIDRSAEDAARAAEAERQKAAAEEKQQQFLKDRDNALHSLKGVAPASGGEIRLKGDTQSFSSQLKSTGPKIEGTTLKTGPGSKTVAPKGVWKQILCAHGLAKTALTAATHGDAEEAGFLLDESARAASGSTLSVDCPEAALPKGWNASPPKAVDMSAFYEKLKDKAVREAKIIAVANEKVPALKKKTKTTAATAAKPAPPTPAPSTGVGVSDIDRVREEQRRINQAHDDELAALREAQKLLNEQNSKKAKAQQNLTEMNRVAAEALRDPKGAMASLNKIR